MKKRSRQEATGPVRILLVSDIEDPYIWDHFDAERFKEIDLVISCGDLKAEYLSFLVTLLHVPLLYVPGNHDTRYEQTPPEGCDCIDGQIVDFKGIRILGLGGSHAYSLGPNQYTQKEMNKKVRRLGWKLWKNRGFDILVTHAPAFGICDGSDLCHIGFLAFRRLLDRYHPRYFFHGHQHLSYQSNQPRTQTIGETTVINAYRYTTLTFE